MRYNALDQKLIVLARGIANGIGVTSVFAVLCTQPILEATATVLFELVDHCKVNWGSWFAVASCVCLECPYESDASR